MPPGSETRSQRIFDDFVTAMSLPDGGSGYFFSISSSQVKAFDGDATEADRGPYPKLIVASGDTRNNGGSNADSDTYMAEEMDIQVEAWLGRTPNVMRDLKRLEHDVRAAALADKTRGALAWTTEWQETETFYAVNNGERSLVVVRFIVQYEVNESDTTTYP